LLSQSDQEMARSLSYAETIENPVYNAASRRYR
jgi:hypothetical protein